MTINKIKRHLKYIECYIKYKIFPNKYIPIQASVIIKKKIVTHYNWGDDINLILVGYLSKKTPLVIPKSCLSKYFKIENYLAIGSILTFFPLKDSIIWGSGIINKNEINKIKDKPLSIRSVRGPKTREILLNLGIPCPPKYGDPALLFPLIYKANIDKKYHIGVIPHFIDVNNPCVEELLKNKSMHLIKVNNYIRWQDFIDEICSCDIVMSSSLHGIIIAEAYGIPAIWTKFGEYVNGWDFKFIDFYESIEKKNIEPFIANRYLSIKDIERIADEWKPGIIDTETIIDSCPFISSEIHGELYELSTKK